jgi:hypothetical protein
MKSVEFRRTANCNDDQPKGLGHYTTKAHLECLWNDYPELSGSYHDPQFAHCDPMSLFHLYESIVVIKATTDIQLTVSLVVPSTCGTDYSL